MSECPVCHGEPHPEYMDKIGGVVVPGCPAVQGNSRDRYLDERRECAARGVPMAHCNDVVFDDLVSMFGSGRGSPIHVRADPSSVT
jgi:hypothetical protein